MKRREFLRRGAYGAGAALVGSAAVGASGWAGAAGEPNWRGFGASRFAERMAALPKLDRKMEASDMVTLGKTGIKTSRLAMGTGTNGIGHHSRQTDQLGVAGLSALLQNGYDNGLRFFDLADAYGSHPHAADALKHVPREKVTVLTKSWSRDPAEMKADLDRFRKELGTEYLDIVLMHCLTDADWTQRYRGVMDVLSEAKEKGVIRAHGCSCHSIEALRAAAKSPWVEVDLVRMNPIGSHMDADPETVAAVIREMRAAGKGIIGMKILGQGDMRNRQDDALKYALSMGLVDAFTIGAENKVEQMDLIARIGKAA
ncbi:MAG TPA: aldo/keto reductase [Candidatus Acidoferrum sp.]|nr:aldo/keto reductase [Candidatus Acidoferrum sp.]